MTSEPTNHHVLDHDHHARDAPCPVCGDGDESLLSAADFGRLSLAMKVGMGRADADAQGILLTAALSARMTARALELALQGRLLPIGTHENGNVFWKRVEHLLAPPEVARYQAKLQRVRANGDPTVPGNMLTAAERHRLTLAANTALGAEADARDMVSAVQEWANTVRESTRDLDEILAGRLLPYIPDDDPERQIQLKPVSDLPDNERNRFQRALDRLAASESE